MTYSIPMATASLLALCLASCGDDPASTGGSKGAAADQPAEVRVANEILQCVIRGDAAAMRPLLNATNSRMALEDLQGALDEMRQTVGDLTAVSEVRRASGRYPEGSVFAKLKDEQGETFVLVLTLEDGKLLFEDINSPSTADYLALEKIWPK